MTGGTVQVEISVTSARWRKLPDAAALARKAVRAVVKRARLRQPVEVSLLLGSDAQVRRLNARYRGKDKPTNVLSFPGDGEAPGQPRLLGDVVVAFETVSREAKAQGKALEDHFVHLVVHGVLHLLGYDHIRHADAVRMEGVETKLLAAMGISDPYAAEQRPRRARP
jgi:probable rRNA maturation factor